MPLKTTFISDFSYSITEGREFVNGRSQLSISYIEQKNQRCHITRCRFSTH